MNCPSEEINIANLNEIRADLDRCSPSLDNRTNEQLWTDVYHKYGGWIGAPVKYFGVAIHLSKNENIKRLLKEEQIIYTNNHNIDNVSSKCIYDGKCDPFHGEQLEFRCTKPKYQARLRHETGTVRRRTYGSASFNDSVFSCELSKKIVYMKNTENSSGCNHRKIYLCLIIFCAIAICLYVVYMKYKDFKRKLTQHAQPTQWDPFTL